MNYPFSAVLGCATDAPDGSGLDDMGLALVLTTIAPEIGGVLVRGEKGTAKSTTVRALAAVLPPIEVYAQDRFAIDPADASATSPDGPFGEGAETTTRSVRLVELPVGATEDRVLGSLHLERALSHGKVEYEPGLLARAHRGILYVDEVNLLHDHLVDLLLDAAAMGRASVERDGVSVEHAARFVLIGTMNPEEGELRPQLLDRFGLTVEVAAPREPALRAEVVRRRMAYDADPAAFVARYAGADRALTERIESARERIGKVQLTEPALLKIAEVCAAFEVDGLRADIVTARTAVAHAAWAGHDEVTKADIRQAALLALPHRRRRNPFDAPGLDEELLDQILGDEDLPPEPPEGPAPDELPTPPSGADDTGAGEPDDGPSQSEPAPDSPSQDAPAQAPSPSAGSSEPSGPGGSESVVAAATPYRPKLLAVKGIGAGVAGRRSRALSTTGRRVGATPGDSGSLDLVETLKAAAGKQPTRGRRGDGGRVDVRGEDLRVAVREGREANLVLFCVDASGSMAARKRMTQVKTAVLSLLLDAYRRRDKVGLITFRGHDAILALPPTHSVEVAATRLEELPAGGRTPLAEGLLEAARVLQRERLRDSRLRPLLVVVTDGRATGGKDAVTRSLQAADHLAGLGVTTIVVDGERGPLRLGLARRLAVHLRAEHLPVSEVSAQALTVAVKGAA
ncbi:VWA domain-containing protein [Nocardioides sp. Kera G14]|nr:VWA domain-containing protein [Nocardioides sp. Kera G14]UDY25026.1 VWA domain-containing protein [Nocardioides sp. Kera G14]